MPIRKIMVTGRNKEKIIAPILKEERMRNLRTVTNDGEILTMVFSEERNYAMKYVVKQYAKSKYKTKEDCITRFEQTKVFKYLPCRQTVWRVVEVIELPDVWLIFFSRDFYND